MQIANSTTPLGSPELQDGLTPPVGTPTDQENTMQTNMDNMQSFVPDRSVASTPAKVQMDMESEEGKKTAEMIRNAVMKDYVNNLPNADKALLNMVGVPTGIVEDTYNAVADTVNYISEKIGGERVLENMNVVSPLMPTDAVSETGREITKFLVSYASIAGKMKAITQPQSKMAMRSVEASAGMMADFTINSPDTEGLLDGLIKELPIGDSIIQYIGSDQSAPFEKRLRNSIFGIAEGAIAEGLFKAVKAIGKVRRSGQIIDDVAKNPELAEPPSIPADVVSDATSESTKSFLTRIEEVAAIKGKGKKEAKLKLSQEIKDAALNPKDGKGLTSGERNALLDIANKDKLVDRESMANDLFPDVRKDDLPPMTLPDGTELTEGFLDTAKKFKAGEGAVNSREMRLDDGTKVFVNLAKMNKPDSFRKVVDGLVTSSPEKYAKEVITDKQTAEIAASYDMTPAQLLEWEEASGLHRGQLLASRDFADESVGAFENTIQRFNEGLATKEEGALAMARAQEFTAKVRSMEHLAGSLLREAGSDPASVKSVRDFQKYVDVFGDDFEQMATVMKESNLTKGDLTKAFMKRSLIKSTDFLTQMRYTSMLSNPATHSRNIFGTGANTMLRTGESVLAATYNAILDKKAHGVTFGDAYHETMGMAQGIMEAIQITGKKMKGQDAPFLGVDPKKAKLSQHMIETAPAPKSVLGKGINFMNQEVIQGKGIGRALVFEDNFMKHINARMTLNREAFRKARLSGAQGEEFQRIMTEEVADPSDRTLKMMYKDAEDATLTGDVEGKTMKALLSLGETPLGKIISPFAKINLNAMNYKLERIPGLNLLMENYRAEWNNIDPQIRQRARAKMGFASSTMAGLGMWLHGSDSITGTGPKDSKKWQLFEQQGRIQGAIRIGDEWVEYRKETPFGSILSMVADIAELNDVTDGNELMVADFAAATTSIVASIYTPEFLVDNGSKLMEAMAKGDVSSAQKLIGMGAEIATTFAPYTALARQANRQLTESGAIKRETNDPTSIYETMKNQIFNIYAPDSLAVKRNILGAPIYHKHGLGPDLVTPFGVSTETQNPVIQELARLSGTNNIVNPNKLDREEAGLGDEFITVQMPPRAINKNIGGESVAMPLRPAEYEKLVQYTSGNHPAFRGKTLEKALAKEIGSRRYKSLPMKEQGLIVSKIIREFRKDGTELYMAENSGDLKDSANKVKNVIKTRIKGF